jgi:hypothetical protein
MTTPRFIRLTLSGSNRRIAVNVAAIDVITVIAGSTVITLHSDPDSEITVVEPFDEVLRLIEEAP